MQDIILYFTISMLYLAAIAIFYVVVLYELLGLKIMSPKVLHVE